MNYGVASIMRNQISQSEIKMQILHRATEKQQIILEENVMGAMKENPRYNVVSIRVSDDELEALQEVSKETRKSISEIMREAMALLQSKGGNPGLRFV